MPRTRTHAFFLLLLASAGSVSTGCDKAKPGEEPLIPPTPSGVAVFDLTADVGSFFDLPWPNDLRRTEDGHISVTAFPTQRNALLAKYVQEISRTVTGWSANGSVYQRFSVSVDPGSLPATVAETLAPTASVFLLDVDATSPARGERHPTEVRYQDLSTRFFAEHTVSIRPVHGQPLAWGRTYAAVFTRDIAPADDGFFARDADFTCILEGQPACAEARSVYQEALDALPLAGVHPDEVLSMAVFTVQNDFEELLQMRDWLLEELPAPTVSSFAPEISAAAVFDEVRGYYGPSPIVQQGTIPYSSAGGNIVMVDGAPVLVDTIDLRFALSVPTSAPPPSGYPIVLYAHGTGGDYRSFIRDGTAARLAEVGIAVMGVDQIHHGERKPGTESPDLLVYNVLNPLAFRDNARQSALDVVQQARLVSSLLVPADLLEREEDAIFDPNRVFFLGHSQGGQNGPLFLAIDDRAVGGVLSGAGSILSYALLEKEDPLSIPSIVKLLLGLPGTSIEAAFEAEGFGHHHPIVTLLQTWVDVADAGNYVHLFFARPRPGFAPKHILMTLGTTDSFTPPGSAIALATAARLPLCSPLLLPLTELDRMGVTALVPPVQGNGAAGAVTVGLLQQDGGHFVAFADPARSQVVGFFATMVDGVPVLQTPLP